MSGTAMERAFQGAVDYAVLARVYEIDA